MSFFQTGAASCVYYVRTRDSHEDPHPRGREFLERWWNESSPFVDLDVLNRARQDLPSVFWELYLAHALRRQGISLVTQARTKKNQRGPDLRAESPDVWIEAVAPNCGTGEDALKAPPLMQAYDIPVDECGIRSKSGSLQGLRQRWDRTTDPCDGHRNLWGVFTYETQ